ncbi:MAG: DUF2975 domain-containing protein [Clostridia bacterium]|nr:DUF2975 domain-containing protein [Clostridia bacterium]
MWNKDRSLLLSIIVCFFLTVVLSLALFFGPWAVELWFTSYRGYAESGSAVKNIMTVFNTCFYSCVPFAYLTLYSLLRLLFNIKNDEVFITSNVKYLRRISWCCLIVAVITFVGGIFYLPLIFMAVAAAFVGLMLRIVKNVMQSAVELKTENELTI